MSNQLPRVLRAGNSSRCWANSFTPQREFLSCKRSEVKVAQSTLRDPMDYTVHGILQARILEWIAFPFSRGSSQPRVPIQVSRIAREFFTKGVTREAHVKGVAEPK